MKQIIFAAALIFAFCFAVFAQVNEKEGDSTKPAAELIAEFNDNQNEWNKVSIDLIQTELLKNSSATGLIRIRNDKNFWWRLNMLKKAMAFQKADLTRITLTLVTEQKSATNVLIMQNCAGMPECENCIVIRAQDINKIEKLFRLKTTGKRKRK